MLTSIQDPGENCAPHSCDALHNRAKCGVYLLIIHAAGDLTRGEAYWALPLQTALSYTGTKEIFHFAACNSPHVVRGQTIGATPEIPLQQPHSQTSEILASQHRPGAEGVLESTALFGDNLSVGLRVGLVACM